MKIEFCVNDVYYLHTTMTAQHSISSRDTLLKLKEQLTGLDGITCAIKDTRDSYVIYVKITDLIGDNDEFIGGEYISEIHESDIRIKQPWGRFLTPNGVTKIG